jgi:hypothetical protein
MEIIKKYTALQLRTTQKDDKISAKLEYGEIRGPYYSQIEPEFEFDTEQEAYEYAFKTDPYLTWLVLPIIRFNNFCYEK